MQTHQKIIEKYRKADAEQRLALFLESPLLRDTFIRIELGEYQQKKIPAQQSTVVNNKVSIFEQIKRIFQWNHHHPSPSETE